MSHWRDYRAGGILPLKSQTENEKTKGTNDMPIDTRIPKPVEYRNITSRDRVMTVNHGEDARVEYPNGKTTVGTRTPLIVEAHQALLASLEVQIGLIQQLQDRMMPVLRAVPPEGPLPEETQDMPCPLASEIQDRTREVRRNNRMLLELTELLEI